MTTGTGTAAAPGVEDDAAPHLVVGVDGSPAAAEAARWASQLAARLGARVVAIAVAVPQPLVAPGVDIGVAATTLDLPAVEEGVRARCRQWLDEAVAGLPGEVVGRVERRVEVGDPTTALLDAAREATMLVLGNHRHGGVAGALLGSVAQQCTHRARCPLVLVPGPTT